MHHADSVRVLHRALSNLRMVYDVAAIDAGEAVKSALARGDASTAKRGERRAAEYQRRVGLVDQLLEQLPADAAGIPAPSGDST